MSDRFKPVPAARLARWVLAELRNDRSVFGIPSEMFSRPGRTDLGVEKLGRRLETPLGLAAGPHTQMAQNLVAGYLMGARFMELKTVQTLDRLDISKPCIDAVDETYNCEWSQELTLEESFQEYLTAWVLLHALRQKLTRSGGKAGSKAGGRPGARPGRRKASRGNADPGFIFNMSVGYNMEGILKPNVQAFLNNMRDGSTHLAKCVKALAETFPEVRKASIPACISDNVTLSTMHGCPPDEIEKIGLYLIRDRGLNTTIKLNPTLLGPERLRSILNDKLGFKDVTVPDEAFGHDLKYQDAVPMIRALKKAADLKGVEFGLKLSNTLEVENHRDVFPAEEKMMYFSGRALHPLTVTLAARLTEQFRGSVPISFCAGADAFNLPALLASGLVPVTVCSDLLRTGGYARMGQYLDRASAAVKETGATDIPGFVLSTAAQAPDFPGRVTRVLKQSLEAHTDLRLTGPDWAYLERALPGLIRKGRRPLNKELADLAAHFPSGRIDPDTLRPQVLNACRRLNLAEYAGRVADDPRYHAPLRRPDTKNTTPLAWFDCIQAPCRAACPAGQNVPAYMDFAAQGRPDQAIRAIVEDNPLPHTTGCVCDHPCTTKCVRNHLDEPLAIRQIKRFAAEQGTLPPPAAGTAGRKVKVAVIGCGPAGLSAAFYLARQGVRVTVFERALTPGGMASSVIPSYRLPDRALKRDTERIMALGVKVEYGKTVGKDVSLDSLKRDGYQSIVIAAGAQKGLKMGIAGEDCESVMDCLYFLREVKAGHPVRLGRLTAVVGGGNSAMDAARTAWRMTDGKVTVFYRRTRAEMPADSEEIEEAIREGIEIQELVTPVGVLKQGNRMVGLKCIRMRLGDRDSSGRPRPVPIEGSDFRLAMDNMIVGIGQQPLIDFLKQSRVSVHRRGTIAVDRSTLRTSVKGIYAGGDVARGPSTVIQAVADGRTMARSILADHSIHDPALRSAERKPRPAAEHAARRAFRQHREPFPDLPADQRRSFMEVSPCLTAAEATKEAQRCLMCDQMCGLCVTVCPNRANHTYRVTPFETRLPELVAHRGRVMEVGTRTFRVEQPFQIVNITNFCNECGNCTTFCPTAGAPYRDKPRLHLDRASFEAERDRAMLITRSGRGYEILARMDGGLHGLLWQRDHMRYASPKLSLELQTVRRDPKLGAVLRFAEARTGPEATGPDREQLSLEPFAQLYVIMAGVVRSLNHILE